MSADATDESIDMKRYDRQIRLWGLDAQKNIAKARVLILGANGLANEIAKNLVLSGVGHVHIQDPGIVDAEALATGGVFSVSEAQKGAGRAEALAEQLKPMNPSVDLVASKTETADLEVSVLQTYHLIIGTRGADAIREITLCTSHLELGGAGGENADPQATAASAPAAEEDPVPTPAKRQRIEVTRSNGTHQVRPMRSPEGANGMLLPKFLAAGTFGLSGFCFLDLGTVTAIITPPKKPEDDKPKADADVAGPSPAAPKPYKEQARYPTVDAAASVEWAALTPRVPRLYYALQLLLAEASEPATGSGDDAAAAALLPKTAATATVKRLTALLHHRSRFLAPAKFAAAASSLITDEYLAHVAQSVGAELSPVAAIVGGMVAAEAIKVISGKDRPINNVFFFDGESGDGITQRLGPSFDCPGGLDKGDFKRLSDATA